MKKMNKFMAAFGASVLAFSLAACGGSSSDKVPETSAPETAAETAAETEAAESETLVETEAAAEDGQNPIMNFIGYYSCDRASIFIEAADGANGAKAQVTWGSSATEQTTWEMSGVFDTENLTIDYSDCIKTNYVYNENGDIESMEQVYDGGTGKLVFTDGADLSLIWQDDQEQVADDMVFTYDIVMPGEEIANPWSEAATLEEAAAGAGLDGFDIVEGMVIDLGELPEGVYRYMDGIVEADYEFPAVSLTIRKGLASAAAEEGDISGDYNEYANSWTQSIKGLEVTCFGNREGDATKTIWTLGDTCYSITAYGLGGDTDYGLSPDDLNSLINGMQ